MSQPIAEPPPEPAQQRASESDAASTGSSRIASFREFYPFYLGEHRNRVCRRLHFFGSTGVLICIASLMLSGNPWWLVGALLCGYGAAWVGHFFFEKNRPATFTYPLWSFAADWVMYRDILTSRIRF